MLQKCAMFRKDARDVIRVGAMTRRILAFSFVIYIQYVTKSLKK